jgi:hypothetical protein
MGINGVYPDYATTTDGRSVNIFNINGEDVVLDWNNDSDNATTEIVNRISAVDTVATFEQYKPTSEEILSIVTKNLQVIANEYANVTNWDEVFNHFAATNVIPSLDELVNLGIDVNAYKNAIVDIVLAEWMSPKMLTKYGFVR